MSSREGTPSSNFDLDEYDQDIVTDVALKKLLEKEIELQLQIDALQTEISQLEERVHGSAKEKVEEELDEQGM